MNNGHFGGIFYSTVILVIDNGYFGPGHFAQTTVIVVENYGHFFIERSFWYRIMIILENNGHSGYHSNY